MTIACRVRTVATIQLAVTVGLGAGGGFFFFVGVGSAAQSGPARQRRLGEREEMLLSAFRFPLRDGASLSAANFQGGEA
jgi:hypothetical protein